MSVNIASVPKYWAKADETYTSNLSLTIAALAATVQVNAATQYNDGDIAVLTVEPGTANEATFVGEKASSPARFINCVWTEGNLGVGHNLGVTITDYDSATHYNLLSYGIQQFANPNGTLKTSAVQAALNLANTPSVGWNVMSQALSWSSHVGNGEYLGSFNGDVTGILSKGMKLLVPRSTAAPTQSMGFVAASSQYGTRASGSVTGFAFTNNFTVEAWIYPTASPTGYAVIISRYDGTSGFQFRFNSDNTIMLQGHGPGVNEFAAGLESLPLNRWSHVAGTVDLNANTGTIWINGRVSPSTYGISGAGTAITNTGPLQIGASNGGNFFNGFIGEVRVWSVAQTLTNIRANKDIALTGGEANLVGLWQGNGNFNDKTANANHLTATGGATSTTLMNTLFGAYANSTEYLVVTNVGAFSGGVTPVTVWGGANGHIPNAGMGTVQYSNARSPFGFPSDKNNWQIESWFGGNSSTAGTGWTYLDQKNWLVPTGRFNLYFNCSIERNIGASGSAYSTLSTLSTTQTDIRFTNGIYFGAAAHIITPAEAKGAVDFSTQTPVYALVNPSAAGSCSLRGDFTPTKLVIESAYV